jgi:hypothetical protein
LYFEVADPVSTTGILQQYYKPNRLAKSLLEASKHMSEVMTD